MYEKAGSKTLLCGKTFLVLLHIAGAGLCFSVYVAQEKYWKKGQGYLFC